MSKVTKNIIGYALVPFATVWDGYVGTCIWSWFVVPTFGLPEISIPVMIGIALMWAWFVPMNFRAILRGELDEDAKGEDGLSLLFIRFAHMFHALFLLIFAAIVHQFV